MRTSGKRKTETFRPVLIQLHTTNTMTVDSYHDTIITNNKLQNKTNNIDIADGVCPVTTTTTPTTTATSYRTQKNNRAFADEPPAQQQQQRQQPQKKKNGKNQDNTRRDFTDEVHEGPREEQSALDGALHCRDEALDPPSHRHGHELAEVVDHRSDPLRETRSVQHRHAGHKEQVIFDVR